MNFWLNIPMQETLLVHEALVQSGGIQELASMLQSKGILTFLDKTENFKVTKQEIYFTGVGLFGGPRASEILKIPRVTDFHHEYSASVCSVEIVDDVYAAIDHIHQYGRYCGRDFTIEYIVSYI